MKRFLVWLVAALLITVAAVVVAGLLSTLRQGASIPSDSLPLPPSSDGGPQQPASPARPQAPAS